MVQVRKTVGALVVAVACWALAAAVTIHHQQRHKGEGVAHVRGSAD